METSVELMLGLTMTGHGGRVRFTDTRTGAVLLDWWPGRGTWISKRVQARGICKDPVAIARRAYEIRFMEEAKRGRGYRIECLGSPRLEDVEGMP